MCKIAKSSFLERICTAWEVTQESIFSTFALLWWFLLLPWFQLFFLWLPNLLLQPWTFVQVLDSHLQLPLNIFTWTAHEDLKISIYQKRAYNSFATNLPTSLVLCFNSFSLSDVLPLWQGKHLESAFFPLFHHLLCSVSHQVLSVCPSTVPCLGLLFSTSTELLQALNIFLLTNAMNY